MFLKGQVVKNTQESVTIKLDGRGGSVTFNCTKSQSRPYKVGRWIEVQLWPLKKGELR